MRKINSLKNFLTEIIPYFIFSVLGFIQVRVFLSNLGNEIYALNQLFIQLFSYISLVEGGVGAIIVQKYYKLLINNDKEKIKSVFAASVKSMKRISLIILIIGIILSFFLEFLTNNSLSISYMQIVFLLYVLRSIIEYLNFSPRLVIQADQKLYKINISTNVFKISETIVHIILLSFKVDYIILLISSIIIRIVMYRIVNRIVFKEYKWLKDYKINSNNTKIRGIGYMFYHKIAGAVYNNVDIILLSAKLSSVVVTIYSSYHYICKYITDAIYMLGNSLIASLGNVIYKESNDTSFSIYEELNSFFIFMATFLSINYMLLSKNFISLWIGEKYIADNLTNFMFGFILFIYISKKILSLVCEAKGLYKETRHIVFFEALVNLVLSLILINFYGMKGVLFATIFAHFVTTFWYYPKYVYKRIFGKKVILYFNEYAKSIFLIGMLFILISYLKININNFIEWFILAVISCIVTGIVIFFSFYLLSSAFRRIIKKLFLMVRK